MAVDVGQGILKIIPDVSGVRAGIAAQLPAELQSLQQTSRSFLGVGAALTAGLTLPLTFAAKTVTDTAISFEAGLAGIAKTVGDVTTITDPLVTQVGGALREIAKEAPIAAEELLRVGEIAGQLGVAAENIPEFATRVAKIAIATDLTTESASFSLARFGNVLGEGTDEVDKYADALIALGNTLPTTESSILSLASRVAGAGSTVGIASEDILALSASLSSVGVNAELGGTAISRVIISIADEVAQGGDKLALFAEVAGTTAEDFARQWEQNPTEALTAFISGLGRMQAEGGNVFKTLEDLGFSAVRVRDVLLRSAGAADMFESALDTARGATGALDVEFAKFAETTQSKLLVAQNRIRDGFIEIGSAGLPVIAGFKESVADLVEALVEAPAPIKSFLGVFVGVAGLVGPVLTLAGTLGQIISTFALMKIKNAQAITSNQQLAASYGGVAAAATGAQRAMAGAAATAGAAGRASVGSAAATGASSALTGAVAGSAVGRVGSTLGRNLNFRNVTKGIGAGMALGIVGSTIDSMPRAADENKARLQNALATALQGAGLGASVGGFLGPKGLIIGGAAGFIGGFVKGITEEIEANPVDIQVPEVQADVEKVDVRTEAIQRGLDEAFRDAVIPIDTTILDEEALGELGKRISDIFFEFNSLVTQYGESAPNIFGLIFDPVKVTEAAAELDFTDITARVATDLAAMDEMDAILSELVGAGLNGLAQQIAEQGGPEALAAARTVRNQLLTDPESVFSLEADLLRLKGPTRNALLDYLNFAEDVPTPAALTGLSDELLKFLPDEDLLSQATANFEGEQTRLVDALVSQVSANRGDLVERFAATFQGVVGEAFNLSLTQDLVKEGGFGIDSDAITEAIATEIRAATTGGDFNTAILNALTESVNTYFEQTDDVIILKGAPTMTMPLGAPVVIRNTEEFLAYVYGEAVRQIEESEFQGSPELLEQLAKGTMGSLASQLLGVDISYPELSEALAASLGTYVQSEEFTNSFSEALTAGDAKAVAEELATLIPERIDEELGKLLQGGGIQINAFNDEKVFQLNIDAEDVKTETGAVGQAITDGITDKMDWPSARTAVETGVQGMIDTAKATLGVESPSTVFAGIGSDVVKGINEGLTSLTVGMEFLAALDLLIEDARLKGAAAGTAFAEAAAAVLGNISFGEPITIPTIPTAPPPPNGAGVMPLSAPVPTSTTYVTINEPTTPDLERSLSRFQGVAETNLLIS